MSSTPPAIRESDSNLLAWLDQAIAAGKRTVSREPAYQAISDCIGFLSGSRGALKPQQLSRVTFNRSRKNTYEVISAMTDVRPIWNYQTYNNDYKKQADILNMLVRNWWRNSYSDKRLQDALMYSAVGGTGYLKIEWNPNLPGGGNIDLIPLDPRDVIPLYPDYNTGIQGWQGVAIRRSVALPQLRQRYPDKFYRYKSASKSWFDSKKSADGIGAFRAPVINSPVLDRLFSNRDPSSANSSDVDLISIFVKDDSLNTGIDRKLMGRPGSNWCYWVYPLGSIHPVTNKVVTEEEARLYPRGRLVICTPECILEDIPNPYWHGQFPIVKFTLDPQPWSILGSSMVADGISMQDSINEVLRGIEDCVKQWLRRSVVGDRTAIARGLLNKIDSRMPGQKILLNPSGGEGVKFLDGPQLPGYVMEYVKFLIDGLDDNYGVKGLAELAKLRQMPSADTVERFSDAQTQILRLRSAQVEQGLAELAEMVKVMIFQYYDTPRRVQILGSDGVTMEDFDYDPQNLIPSTPVGSPDYRVEYDPALTNRIERAQRHHRNFTFSVNRNSMLATSHTQQKMFLLQLARMPGAPLVDPWTLLEAFDVPNLGPIPKGSVFDRIEQAQQAGIYPPSQLMMMQLQQAQQQAQMQAAAAQGGGGGPQGPPKKPEGPPGHPGRPPSGEAPPHPEMRTDPQTGGQRQVISET